VIFREAQVPRCAGPHRGGQVRIGSSGLALLALLAFCSTATFAHAEASVLEDYHVRVYGPPDGLPVTDARQVAQVRNGFLYVATGRGLARFDGRRFRNVPLEGFESTFVLDIFADTRGRIWVRSAAGDLGVIENSRFRPVARSIPGRIRWSDQTADGRVWIVKERGLVEVRPDGDPVVTDFGPDSGLPARQPRGVVLRDGRAVVVYAVDEVYVEVVDSETKVRSFEPTAPLDLPPGPDPETLNAQGGNVWITTRDTVWRVDEQGTVHADPLRIEDLAPRVGERVRVFVPGLWHGEFARVLERAGLVGHEVLQVLRDGDDSCWILSIDRSRSLDPTLLRVEGNAVDRVALLDGEVRCNDMLMDHEGSLWFGTDRGLVQLVPRAVTTITREQGLVEGFTTAVLETVDGSLWVGTWGGGLHRFAGRERIDRLHGDALVTDRVRSLYEARDGSLWAGTLGGVARIRGGEVIETLSIGSSAKQEHRDFAETSDGRFWVATAYGLAVRDDSGLALVDPDRRDSLWSLHVDRDDVLWAGGETGVFRRVDAMTLQAVPGFEEDHVVSIHEDPEGALWFGTYESGLVRWRNGLLARVTTEHGLYHDGVWSMLHDDQGDVWMSCDQGVFRIAFERLTAVADALERGREPATRLRPVVFTEDDGLPSRECNRASPAGSRLSDGRLVFNNLRGVAIVDPARTPMTPPPPTALIEAAADGEPVPVHGTAEIGPGMRHLLIEYVAISYVRPGQQRHRYRLDGYDTEWVEAGDRRRAVYTNIAPGRYIFRVQSASGASDWGAVTSWPVHVGAFVWQTWWFRTLVVIGVALFLFALHLYRAHHLLRMQRMRLRIASDLHDDVGSNLSSIAILSEIIQNESRVGEDGREHLQRLNDAATETMVSLRDIIWLVDPAHENVGDLTRKMRRTARDQLNGTECLFDLPRTGLERRIDTKILRTIYLIYKESIHNVSKHAGASRVKVAFSVDEGRVRLEIQDDGSGFDPKVVERGHGLDSMQRRAEEVGGRLEIESGPNAGSVVRFVADMA